jgi:hypothetical protein
VLPQGRRPAPWPPCRARGSRRKSGSFPLTCRPPAPPPPASQTTPSTTGEGAHPCPAAPRRRHGQGHPRGRASTWHSWRSSDPRRQPCCNTDAQPPGIPTSPPSGRDPTARPAQPAHHTASTTHHPTRPPTPTPSAAAGAHPHTAPQYLTPESAPAPGRSLCSRRAGLSWHRSGGRIQDIAAQPSDPFSPAGILGRVRGVGAFGLTPTHPPL